jgi:hypothetical protein
MTWISPLTALIAAGIAVPALLLMYFLKLRRTTQPVSSTFLWKRAVQDLQVNAPFRRIRPSWLLLVQLLLLAAMLLALAQPVLNLASGPGRRVVILIDRSASMNTVEEGGRTRLEIAKAQALQIVGSLRQRSSFALTDDADQAMIIAFDRSARVVCNFTSNRSQLQAAIDAIEPTDAPGQLSEALKIAKALAPGQEQTAAAAASLELFSDGRLADLAQLTFGVNSLRYHQVGSRQPNLAVTAMAARRNHQQPDEVEVFATVSNFAGKPAKCDVQLSLNGQIRAVREVQIDARRETPGVNDPKPGQAAVSFTLAVPQAGVLEVRQLRSDALANDDAAWAVLPPPKTLSALLVTNGSIPLKSALQAAPLERLDVISPAEFDALDADALSVTPRWDVIVLDRHAPPKLPRGQYIVFGPPPAASGATIESGVEHQFVVDWRSRHPLLQFVNMGNVFAARARKLKLPASAQVLAEFNNAPAITLCRRGGSSFVLLPFDVMETNWPFEPSLVLFFCNATTFLGLELAGGEQSLPVGDVITLENLPADSEVQLAGPHELSTTLNTGQAGLVRFAGTSRAGLYRFAVDGAPPTLLAVNMLSEYESDIEPAEFLDIPGQQIAAEQNVVNARRELWPYLALLGLVLVLAEWAVYNLKVRF